MARTKIIAHRGASSVAPENTLAAFVKAVEFGSDYFELDVRSSLDDSLVIMHDATIDRTTNGSGAVTSLTYDNLLIYDAGSWFSAEFAGEKIPLLTEALDLALDSPYEVGVIIEIKAVNSTIVGKVIKEVERRNMQDRVVISSFNFSQIQESKIIDSSIPVQLFGTITQTQINQVNGIGGEWVGTGGSVTQALLDSTHAKNMFLNKWTVNSAYEMLALIDLGVDAITTNYPQTAIDLMNITSPPGIESGTPEVTDKFSLDQNYPNPFNPSTTIEFDLPKTSFVSLKIFNILGEEVATLDSDRLTAGTYTYEWDAGNFVSGVYLYRLEAEEFVETRMMVLMR